MRKTIHATAVAMAALLASGPLTAEAADMSMAPLYQPEGPMVEAGSGWYLRGDVGYANMSMPLGVAPGYVSDHTSPGPAQSLFSGNNMNFGALGAGAGVGYQFNKWFRMDTTLDWRQQHTLNVTSYGQICPIDSIHNVTTTSTTSTSAPNPSGGAPLVTTVTTTSTQTNVPYLDTTNNSCYKNDTQSLQSWTGLLNFYGDLGSWFGVTPYVGGGAGVSSLRASAGENWFWNTGSPYGGAGPNAYLDAVSGNLVHLGYAGNAGPSQSRNNFSWALMAGVSYDLAPHLKLDIGYRYLNMGFLSGINASGQTVHRTVDTQEVRAGLRFTPDL